MHLKQTVAQTLRLVLLWRIILRLLMRNMKPINRMVKVRTSKAPLMHPSQIHGACCLRQMGEVAQKEQLETEQLMVDLIHMLDLHRLIE